MTRVVMNRKALVLSVLLTLACTLVAQAAMAGPNGGFGIDPPLSGAEKKMLADFVMWVVIAVASSLL